MNLLWQGQEPPPSFWQANGDKILVALITAVITLLLQRVLPKIWKKVSGWFVALGLGFRKRYLRALADEHGRLHLIGIRTRGRLNPPRLREVFISLRVGRPGQEDGETPLDWAQIFQAQRAEEKRVVLLGEPGAGKSTLLDYLVLVFAGEVNHPLRRQLGQPLPLYARLREVGEERSLEDLLFRPDVIGPPPRGYFERQLRAGRCVVLLDGLDEVLDAQQHEQVVREIKRLTHDYPDNWFVVTCREAGWREQLPGFRLYSLRPLEEDEIRGFILNWYREVLRADALASRERELSEQERRHIEQRAREQAEAQAADLWQALQKNSGLLRTARTPLILSLITLVHYVRQTELPKGRAQLYRRCLEILLEEWDLEDKRLQIPNRPSLGDKILALQHIAFHFARQQLLEMDAAGLEALLEPLLPQFSVSITARDFIQHIYERSGVLVEKRIGHYGFAHRALQDYLTATYIVEHGLDDLLLEHAGEEPWHEVLRIAIGLLPTERAERLLQELLRRGEHDPYNLALAGWSLAEDVQVGESLREEVRGRLFRSLERQPEGSLAAAYLAALGEAAPEELQHWMRHILSGRDPALRRWLLGLLPELLPSDVAPLLPLLLSLAAEEGEALALRVEALNALGRLRLRPGGEVWETLARLRQHQEGSLRQAATFAWCGLGRYEALGLVRVPAGTFLMGSDPQRDPNADKDEQPQHTVYLPEYYIGRAPVTVAEFREFVEATGYRLQDQDALKGPEDYPVRWVTWYDALAYARWRGMSLPSEAEWEKAARGTDGRIYPWGDEWLPNHANTSEYWERKGRKGPTPVGMFSPQGDSPYGCVDMSGNVWEWTRSLWGKDWEKPDFGYPYDPADGRENLDASRDARRVVRGGSFFLNRRFARAAVRDGSVPLNGVWNHGIRVVVVPVSASDL